MREKPRVTSRLELLCHAVSLPVATRLLLSLLSLHLDCLLNGALQRVNALFHPNEPILSRLSVKRAAFAPDSS